MNTGAAVAVAVLVATVLAGCEIDAAKGRVFITRESRIVVDQKPAKPGETIIDVENNDDARHKLVLLRLVGDAAPGKLPVRGDGTIEVGKPGDIEYDGEGYRVVEKLEEMRPYYGGDRRIMAKVHTYLEPGRYVFACNLPGGYQKGVWAELRIGEMR